MILRFLLWNLFIFSVFAGNKQFERITLEDGLSHASVYTIIQDKTGFMWFGTLSGLNRYDGYQFVVYKADPDDPSSLSESFINSLAEDHNGFLWIGTFSRGLNRFDPATEQFTHYFDNPDSSFNLVNCRIGMLQTDPLDPDMLWIGTSKKGLIRFNTVTSTYTIFNSDDENNPFLNHNHVTDMVIDSSQQGRVLWIGTGGGGLNKVDLSSGISKFYLHDSNNPISLSNNFISSVFQDPDDERILWLGTDNGLNKFDKVTQRFTRFSHDPDDITSISNDKVYNFFQDRSGNFWIGTNDGLNIMDKKKETFERYYHSSTLSNSLSQNSVFSIFQDHSGILWIGTDNGLNKYDPLKERFRLYQNEPDNPHSLGQNYVRDIVKDPFNQNIYWIATHGGGLEKFDIINNSFSHYRHSEMNTNSVGGDEIYDLCLDHNNGLWIAHADGLDFMDLRTEQFIHFPNNSPHSITNTFAEVITLFADKTGILWIGTWGAGVRRLDINQFYKQGRNPANSRFFKIDARDTPLNGLNDNSVVWFEEVDSGNVWIATVQGGINIWNRATGAISFLEHDLKDNTSLSHNYVTVIFKSGKGEIWVATRGGGLNKFNPVSRSFKHYTEKDGLVSDAVVGIQEDHRGHLWITTVNGMSDFDPVAENFKNYDVHDGLQSNQFYGLSYYDKNKKMMIVGGINGLNTFYPDRLKDNEYIPPVVITKLLKQDLKSKKYKIINIPGVTQKEGIRLSYKDDFISIVFAALNYHNSQKNQYQYRLFPLKKSWINMGNKNRLTFTRLDPGTYQLQVRGSNDDGKWNLAGVSLGIVISPPWWRSKWAYLSYIILFLTLLVGVDRYQRRKIIIKEREKAKRQKEELILKQAEELELIDGIVRTINREYDLKTVLITLLHQGLKLFPQAENAAVLMYDHNKKHFAFSAAVGYEDYPIEKVTFSMKEMTGYYAESADEVEKGVYLVRNFKNISNTQKFEYLPIPKSLILMSATWDMQLEGFVIFANLQSNAAFDHSDVRKLKRFREHAISAIIKSIILNELINKNEKLIKTKEQLVTQQKLASLGQLTAGIAHEIQNPLNFVNNFSELSVELVDELKDNLQAQKNNISRQVFDDSSDSLEMLRENISKIAHHGKRADRIIRSMLLHSRGEEGVFSSIMINSLLEESINLAYHGMRAQNSGFNVTIELDLSPDAGSVEVVPQNINRVFLNIFQNAFYALSQNSDIREKVEGQKVPGGFLNNHNRKESRKEPKIMVKTKKVGDFVEIRIRDNGPGIPEAVRNEIFNPFFSTKPTGEGTGLGLSIAYDIVVHEHNGELTFYSKENEFTEFIIRIPVTQENSPKN